MAVKDTLLIWRKMIEKTSGTLRRLSGSHRHVADMAGDEREDPEMAVTFL